MASMTVMLIIIIIANTSRGAEITTEKDYLTSIIATQETLYRCPALISTEYQVTVANSFMPLMTGCAYLTYTSGDIIEQSYMVWFGTEEFSGEDCHDLRMKYYRFSCLTKNLVLTKDRYEGLMLLRLYEEDYNKTGTPDYKCALYEGQTAPDRSSFRFAISQNASCKGLLDVLYPPPIMMFTELNEGATLLSFSRKQANVNNVRKRRHALPNIIGGDSERSSVMFLQSSQSNFNGKDNSTNTATTTDDTHANKT